MLKGIFIDWNGTLLNDTEVSWGSVCAIFAHYGVPPPKRDKFFMEIGSRYLEVYHRFGIPESAKGADLNPIRIKYFEEHWHEAKLREGAREFLSWCSETDIRTAIVSAEQEVLVRKRVDELGILRYVDHIRADARYKALALRQTLGRFDLHPRETVYVTDTADDIAAAREERVRTIAFTDGYHPPERVLRAEPTFPNARFPSVANFHTVRAIAEDLRNGKR